ncbi:MAG: hypothetical protein SCH71_17615 [Desulfobulbaceae bacterium]|nr:hypothetical protein [Desulfobulbaceae bacterium]
MGKQKEALKQAIMDEFLLRMRQAKAAGPEAKAELDPKWLYEDFLPSLSTREEEALEEILAEMIHEGIIVRVDGRRATYRLTRKGADFICL